MVLTRAGWPRPILNGLPTPWVSDSDDLANMHSARAVAAASSSICAVCGEDHGEGDEVYMAIRHDPSDPVDLADMSVRAMDNAFMHRRCLLLAVRNCPVLRQLHADGGLTIVATPANMAEVLHDEELDQVYGQVTGEHCRMVSMEDLRRGD